MNSTLDNMYRDIILDHYRSPRGHKPIVHPDITSGGHNPSCGDELSLTAEVEDGVLKEISVDCHGCAISVASASMLTEAVRGKTFEEVKKIAEAVKKMLKGEIDDIPEDLEDIEALKGVRQFPVRIKCALLSWVTLIEGIKQYAEGKGTIESSVSTEDDTTTKDK